MRSLIQLVSCILIIISITAPALYSNTLPIVGNPQAPGVSGYNETIPKPEDILGYTIGEKHTRHHLIVEYFQTVARASDRVEYGAHGRTHDGHKLVHAIVTSPENHARIDEIRAANLKLSTDPMSVSDEDITRMPAIVWMGYGVHGNEASSFEAALLLLYHLAAGEGDQLNSMLQNLVIILIPSLNPDGHTRHVNWVNTNRGAVPTADPQHREHNEPWPGGRTNYYWFDLNRDWFPIQHPESQGRIKLYNTWRPHLVTDYHEFGSQATYFFQPGIASRYNPHIPENSIDLLKNVGDFHASALDERGVLYYTRETFDDFYIGKGSTYPMVTGAVGILFEQASSRALKRETARGTLTFDFGIMNQFTTSLSTLEACYTLREDLLKNHRRFYREAHDYSRQKGLRAFIINTTSDRTRAQEMIGILRQHRIDVYRLAQSVRVAGTTFEPEDAVIIPTEQPEARLIFAALERRTEFTDSLFYDVSSWTLPLAFNLPYAGYRQNPRNLIGEKIEYINHDGGGIIGGRARYAYILEWNGYYAPRALYRLQSNNVQTMVAMRPFVARVNDSEKEFMRGSIIVTVSQPNISEDELYGMMQTVADKDHVGVHAVQSSRTVDGPDLGSPAIRVLNKPEVAIISGTGTSPVEVGEAWHLLGNRMQMPVTLLNTDAIGDADLARYTTLVMVNGTYSTFTNREKEKIQEWVQGGGTLITTKNATLLAAQNGLLNLQVIETDDDFGYTHYEDIMTSRGAQRIGGAIFEARMDTTHPVAFGYDHYVPLFRNHETFFEPSKSPGQTVAVYSDTPLLSGYISDKRLEELKNTAAIIAQRNRQGRVIAFADNPNFRAFWYGTNGLFLNAIFFGGVF